MKGEGSTENQHVDVKELMNKLNMPQEEHDREREQGATLTHTEGEQMAA